MSKPEKKPMVKVVGWCKWEKKEVHKHCGECPGKGKRSEE